MVKFRLRDYFLLKFAQNYKKKTIFYALVCFTFSNYTPSDNITTQPAFTSPKLTIETLEQGVKYVQN